MRRPAALALLLALLPLSAAGAPEIDSLVERLAAAETGRLWGRLLIEEESPEGPFTPLVGTRITLYPDLPELGAELETIRSAARRSAADYENAIQRVLATLAAHRARLEAAGGARLVLSRETDPRGFFAVDALPAGEWLVVAVHAAPYRAVQARKPRAPKKPEPVRGLGGGLSTGVPAPSFLPREKGEAKEVDLWVYRVRVPVRQAVGVTLTDRNRWLTGPVWEGPQKEKTPQGPKTP